MSVIFKGTPKRFFIALITVASLNGCVAVPYGGYVATEDGTVYRGPVYVVPPPVYAEPPVYFNFGFGYWGKGRGYHGGRGRHRH